MNADNSAAGIAQSLPLGVKSSHLVGAHLLRHFATSPKATGKPRRTFVDAARSLTRSPLTSADTPEPTSHIEPARPPM